MSGRRATALMGALLALLLLCGCAAEPASLTGFYMDTVVELTAYGDDEEAQALLFACRDRLRELEGLLSAYEPTSDIARLNSQGGEWVALSGDAYALLEAALELAQQTGGAFDPTIFPAVLAWDSMSGSVIPSAEELSAIAPLVDYTGVELDPQTQSARLRPGQMLDLGGIAKGYAADELARLYREHGACGIINLGGNVYAVGKKPGGIPFQVGVRDPIRTERLLTTLELADCSAVTSGTYERYFEQGGVRYHHILDPNSLQPSASGLCSATVLDASSVRGDALATAAVVLGAERAQELLQGLKLTAILVTDQGESILIQPKGTNS